MMKVLPEPETSVRCAHNQSFGLLKPEAGIARTLVEHPLFGRKPDFSVIYVIQSRGSFGCVAHAFF